MVWLVLIFIAAIPILPIVFNLWEQRQISERKRLFESDLKEKRKREEFEKAKLNEAKKAKPKPKPEPKKHAPISESRSVQIPISQPKDKSEERFKTNWREFSTILSANNITTLYHFTDYANLSLIKSHGGLYSWHYCLENKIQIPFPGGDELSRSLDRRYDVQNYVRLSFTRNHPMMFIAMNQGRINNPVILEINPEVIFWKNTKYANKNATRNDVNIGDGIDDFKKIRFDLLRFPNHFGLSEQDRPFFQAEILILEKIPIQYVRNLTTL